MALLSVTLFSAFQFRKCNNVRLKLLRHFHDIADARKLNIPKSMKVMPPPSRRISLSEVGRRNIVLSDAEQIVMRNALKTTEAGLLRLDTLRSNGGARRRQLKDQIHRCKVALAPYKKIPKEIWLYIFELYWPADAYRANASVFSMATDSTIDAEVCDIHLGEGVNLARMWLGRAGNIYIPRILETSEQPSHWFSSNRPQAIQSFICSFPFRKLRLTEYDAARVDFTGIPVESLLLLEDLALLKPARNSRYQGGIPSFSPLT